MNKTFIIAALLLAAVITPASAGTKKIGTINGVDIYRIKTAGVFAPSSTTIIAADPKKPGSLEVINQVGGPGFVPAVANAGGIAGGAALLRPARSNTSVEQTGGSNANVNAPSTTVNSGNPVVNVDNSSHNHHNN